jgi:hypothetical protein
MTNPEEKLQWLVDRAAVIDTVVAFANAFDAQDWGRLRGLLADEVFTDYSQFRGDAPARVTAEAYVAARRTALTGLRTLHLSTNHAVTVNGDRAECVSTYRIYRLDPNGTPGADRFDTAGTYEHALVRNGEGWRICAVRQTVVVQEGNPAVHGAFRRGGVSAEGQQG